MATKTENQSKIVTGILGGRCGKSPAITAITNDTPKEETKKNAEVISGVEGSFVIESSIINDDKFNKINADLSKIYDKAMVKKSKIEIFDGQISEAELELQNYMEMVETRKSDLDAIKSAAARVQTQYNETISMMNTIIRIKEVYEEQLQKEVAKVEKLEKELESSNRRTYRTFKETQENKTKELEIEKDKEITKLKQQIEALEKENKKLKASNYIGSAKNKTDFDEIKYSNDCLNNKEAVLFKDIRSSKSSLFMLKYTVNDSKNKERIIIKRLVIKSTKMFGDKTQILLFDLHNGKPLDESIKEIIMKTYEDHIDLLDDAKLSQFYDKIVKVGDTSYPLSITQKCQSILGTNGLFIPVDMRKLANIHLCEVR